MKLVLSHPTGNANVRAAAIGFLEAGILDCFYTAIATFPGNIFDLVSSIGPFSDFNRRRFDPLLKDYTRKYPWLELGRHFASGVGLKNLLKHEKGIFSIDAVYKNLDRHVAADLEKKAKRGINTVYAYEDAGVYSFRKAKSLGLQCYYDLPIGYWRSARKLLEPEKGKWPEWIPTLTSFEDSEEKLLRKDQEIKLADKIFVASQFTANTLKDFEGILPPIEVISYGFPPVTINREYSAISGRPLKLLFVGGLSQRKGIANLFEAVETFGKHVELTVVGAKPNINCIPLEAALRKHRWIPSLSNKEVITLMKGNDVLVFPSLFEGFGLVINEAMSQGTPVITTDRTAGPDFIKHKENGWLIEASSTDALRRAIEELLINPEKISIVGRNAMETASIRPWTVYGKELAEAVINNRN